MPDFNLPSNGFKRRQRIDQLFRSLCVVVASIVVVILIVLISTILHDASSSLTFEQGPPRLVSVKENDTGISQYDRYTSNDSPRISILKYTGPPDSMATIYARRSGQDSEGKVIGNGKPRRDGSFEIDCQKLADGQYDLWFELTDVEGTLLETSPSIIVNIDTYPPSGLELDKSTLGDEVLVASELSEFVIGGSGIEPTASVKVGFRDSLGETLEPVKARIKEGGKWRIPPTNLERLLVRNGEPVPTGKITIEAVQRDRAGNAGKPVRMTFDVDRNSTREADLQTEFDNEQVDLSVLEEEPIYPTHVYTFFSSYHHDNAPELSGIRAAIIGSTLLCLVCAVFTIPIGIGTAVFMEDFKPKNRILRLIHGFIQLNINNLAGVPSIVYGILGVTAFVYMFSLFPSAKANRPPKYELGTNYYYQVNTLSGDIVKLPCEDKYQTTIEITESVEATGADGRFMLQVVDSASGLSDEQREVSVRRGKRASIVTSEHYWYYFALPLGKGFLAAGLTLGLVVLPIIIIAAQEAIRGVPSSLREASLGMGATRWQTVRNIVLPSATPGIMTGAILALSRAIGEAAPVLAVMGGVISNTGGPSNLMDNCTALPIVIYKWAKDASRGFHSLSAAAIIVLLLLLLLMNSVAIVIRSRAEKMHR